MIVRTLYYWSLRDPRGFTWEPTSLSSPSPSELPARFGPSPGMVLPFTGDLSLHRAQQVSGRNWVLQFDHHSGHWQIWIKNFKLYLKLAEMGMTLIKATHHTLHSNSTSVFYTTRVAGAFDLFRLSPFCMHLGSRASCARNPYSTPTELKKLKLPIRILCCLPLQETVGTTSPLHPNRSWGRCLLGGHQSSQ